MSRKKKVLLAVLITLFVGLAVAVVINRFYYSWTDHVALFRCTQKRASVPRNRDGEFEEQKLDYFTKVKFSYESLHGDVFAGKIRSNPNYTTERGYGNRSISPLDVKRIINGNQYVIRFNYIWKQTGTEPSSKIYDGIGVSYSAYENCGVPNYQFEKNFRMMINELPLDEELRSEMNKKLSLEFSIDRYFGSFF